ncbi:Crp/Fnr family transcriptional regulator [Lipingzhangella sp. LS1_29]|uniref:Crp/Fnr family transcriptional regulator n=1 Tax=Lipingzhangella rawalii TaxID=2055835 RepID=A0ABU2HBA3_9ACTN|nr:Crp/Fnr family transcriptional regulator [Lipingzhangella rawalii]MDS1271864.1 Crp/Fnr family transcriptional regulator [Lipingzhangella rawalii]
MAAPPPPPPDGASAFQQALRALGTSRADGRIQQAAWVARCIGRGNTAPLTPQDLTALAETLESRTVARGAVAYGGPRSNTGVWILRSGRLELAAGAGPHRVVLQVLRGGDVDGDIALLLDMPLPYTARALEDSELLHLDAPDFDHLLTSHPTITRRWLSSVAERLNASHMRIIGLLGGSLTQQTARLLLEEADDDSVVLTQRNLAAMLGVRRPSMNRVLKELEAEGVIALRYSAIDIRDRGRLETFS